MRFGLWLYGAVTLLGAIVISDQSSAENKRVALVIGNSAYEHTPPLTNPKNDADDMTVALQGLGFEVFKGVDLKKSEMERTVRDFASALVGSNLGLFFYAGHGLQVNGVNYLVPTDAQLTTSSALDFEMVRLDIVQRAMESESQSNVIILDACRDNPLSRNLARALGTRSTSIGRGLAQFEAGIGTLISFSTQPGNVALDGSGRNSPYTGALVKHIASPAEDLTSVLIKVRNDVISSTASRQVPWDQHALRQPIYLAGKPNETNASSSSMPSNSVLNEIAQAWDATKDTASIAVLETFAQRYKSTIYADLATARIGELRQLQKAPISPSPAAISKPPITDAASCSQADNIQYCVSSALATSGVNRSHYGPRSLSDGDPSTAWVEGAPNDGQGEWIVLSWPSEMALAGLRVVNGYAKSNQIFSKNGRVTRLRLTFSNGQTSSLKLEDRSGAQTLRLTQPVLSTWIKIEIEDAMPGEKYRDTAISELQPLFN